MERTGEPVVITDRGVPVLKLMPYQEDQTAILASLRGTLVEYVDPFEPVDLEDWDAL